jgi:preprotein translocase subunit SecE
VALEIYKSGQGRYVRVGTAIGAVVVMLVLANYLRVILDRNLPGGEDFRAYKTYVEYAVPVAVLAAMALVTAYFLNKPNFVDFLIATESEMKKVSWSSRAELVGSTAVVIVTVFLLAAIIWLVDTFFVLMLTRGLGLW